MIVPIFSLSILLRASVKISFSRFFCYSCSWRLLGLPFIDLKRELRTSLELEVNFDRLVSPLRTSVRAHPVRWHRGLLKHSNLEESSGLVWYRVDSWVSLRLSITSNDIRLLNQANSSSLFVSPSLLGPFHYRHSLSIDFSPLKPLVNAISGKSPIIYFFCRGSEVVLYKSEGGRVSVLNTHKYIKNWKKYKRLG